MILDKQQMFSEEQSITGNAASTNYIDLGPQRRGEAGTDMELLIQVREAFTAAGAATLTIDLETDDNTSFSSATVLASSGVIAKASLTLDSEQFKIKIPAGAERYVRLNYTVATGPMTAGKLDAGLVLARDNNL